MGNASSFMVYDVCEYVLKELDELDESNKFTCVVENWVNDNYKKFMIRYIYIYIYFRNAMYIIFS